MSEVQPQAGWEAAVVEWRKAHPLSDDHPVVLCLQLFHLQHQEDQRRDTAITATLEELEGVVASLGEGFADLQKHLVGIREAIGKPPKAPAESVLPMCVVVAIAVSAIVAGFCLGRAFV